MRQRMLSYSGLNSAQLNENDGKIYPETTSQCRVHYMGLTMIWSGKMTARWRHWSLETELSPAMEVKSQDIETSNTVSPVCCVCIK